MFFFRDVHPVVSFSAVLETNDISMTVFTFPQCSVVKSEAFNPCLYFIT